MTSRFNHHRIVVNEAGEGYNPHEAAEWQKAGEKWAAEWTLEATAARRAAWNEFARSLPKGPVSGDTIRSAEKSLGFAMGELKIAIAHYSL